MGSGQLGRMLAIAARQMGYRVHVFSPDSDSPTGQVADLEISAEYDDLDAVRRFAQGVDVVTYEFENVPAATAAACEEFAPLHPGPRALHVAQHRLREKQFFVSQGLAVAPFASAQSLAELKQALAEIGTPAILKTAASGYDGKGQVKILDSAEAEAAWSAIDEAPAVLEGFVAFEREVSVVGARGQDGRFAHFGVIENDHRNHILDVSIAPAAISAEVAQRAIEMAQAVLEGLDVVGVLCVEFFLQADGTLLINEMAPRPHNSGHLTVDACVTSQFEQQLRAICGLPLGDTRYLSPAAMANLLGDEWELGEPDWATASAESGVKLHLYGKKEPRIGRKMGHLTALANSVPEAIDRVKAARAALTHARDERMPSTD